RRDTFTQYTLSWTSASTSLALEFAGHLAVGSDGSGSGIQWTPNKGSSNISGGPYHVSIDLLDGASLGNLDNQIAGADILLVPTVVTTSNPSQTNIAPGSSVTDTATVSGSGLTPSGTVTFFLCQPSEVTSGGCEGTAGSQVGGVKTLVAGSATSDATTNTNTPGKYCWRAEYSGGTTKGPNGTSDTYGPKSHTNSTTECFNVVVSPTISTELHNAATNAVIANGSHLPLGSGVYDIANLGNDGGAPFTGTVTFKFFSGGDCTTGTPVTEANVALNAGGTSATSSSHLNLAAGNYAFNAQYIAGTDTNHTNSPVSSCEPFTIDKAQLSITTTVHDAAHNVIANGAHVPLGTNAHDNATVTGAVAGFPIGAISFTFNAAAIANGSTEASFDATSIATGALGAGSYVFNASVATN